ncbi:hypothetical protein C8A05DRAFT_32423 [Staphylotrichum tortipilum]|uniref:Uncharacterized protein n=1 Tax=Staphylotrichum tortipilum TaxID=2831512 RepID=A0AAN6MMW3_9PEZI|nr:hypothetical protein C8A05DRAFT_32423 [Staphylotrichum longicolle]
MSLKKHRLPPEPPSRVDEWLARVSQTVFRVLIVGAALAEGQELGTKAFDFLRSFAAYDLEAPLEAQDVLFAPLADRLLTDILGDQQGREAVAARFEKGVGRAEFCRSRDDWPCPLATVVDVGGSSHSDAHPVVREHMKMSWVVEQLRPWDAPEPAAVSWEGPSLSEPAVVSGQSSASLPSTGPADSEPPPPLALAVFFGIWRAEKVALPTCPGFTGDWHTLHAHPAVSDPVKDESSVQSILDTAFFNSGRPNHFEYTDPAPPLELKFFE